MAGTGYGPLPTQCVVDRLALSGSPKRRLADGNRGITQLRYVLHSGWKTIASCRMTESSKTVPWRRDSRWLGPSPASLDGPLATSLTDGYIRGCYYMTVAFWLHLIQKSARCLLSLSSAISIKAGRSRASSQSGGGHACQLCRHMQCRLIKGSWKQGTGEPETADQGAYACICIGLLWATSNAECLVPQCDEPAPSTSLSVAFFLQRPFFQHVLMSCWDLWNTPKLLPSWYQATPQSDTQGVCNPPCRRYQQDEVSFNVEMHNANLTDPSSAWIWTFVNAITARKWDRSAPTPKTADLHASSHQLRPPSSAQD